MITLRLYWSVVASFLAGAGAIVGLAVVVEEVHRKVFRLKWYQLRDMKTELAAGVWCLLVVWLSGVAIGAW